MTTPKSQRIGIIIIGVVMFVGTLGSFAAMVLASENQARDTKRQQEAYAKYQKDTEKQADELSAKHYPEFSGYASKVSEFNRDEVKEVAKEDLKIGDGEEITDKTAYSAYYIGWNPKGKVFDQSIEGNKLKPPIPGSGLIPGWSEGVKGMKLGGVRMITIPSDKAYGEAGQGDDIPPNTPIRFIVMAIPTPPAVPLPDELNTMQGVF